MAANLSVDLRLTSTAVSRSTGGVFILTIAMYMLRFSRGSGARTAAGYCRMNAF